MSFVTGAVLLSTLLTGPGNSQTSIPQSDINQCRQRIERMLADIKLDPGADLVVLGKNANSVLVKYKYEIGIGMVETKYAWQRLQCIEQ